MPKLSEIEIGPNDILVTDVADEAIARLRAAAESEGVSFSNHVLALLAAHVGIPREALTRGSVVVLDEE